MNFTCVLVVARTLVKVLLISSIYQEGKSCGKQIWKVLTRPRSPKGKKPKPVGLQSGEQNVLSLLSQDITSDILDDIGVNLYQDNITEDKQLPDIVR